METMTDPKDVFEEIDRIDVTFEGSEKIPVKMLRYLFLQLTAEWKVGCNIYPEDEQHELRFDGKTFNIVITDNMEVYQNYTSFEWLFDENCQHLLVIFCTDGVGFAGESSVPFADMVILNSLLMDKRDEILDKIASRPKRAQLFREMLIAQDAIDQGVYDAAVEILDNVLKVKPNMTWALVLLSDACEKSGQFDKAMDIIMRALDKSPDNYQLLKRSYLMFVNNNLYDVGFEILQKLLNSFAVDDEILKAAVSSAIASNNQIDITKVIDYYFEQDLEYQKLHKKQMMTTLYVFIKHLIINDRHHMIKQYTRQLAKESEDKDVLIRLVDISYENKLHGIDQLLSVFEETRGCDVVALYSHLLKNLKDMTRAQAIHRAKELIDLEGLESPNLYQILLDRLRATGNDKEFDEYLEKYKKCKRKGATNVE
jgi:tetratricopeptide (TPR) repeat protein